MYRRTSKSLTAASHPKLPLGKLPPERAVNLPFQKGEETPNCDVAEDVEEKVDVRRPCRHEWRRKEHPQGHEEGHRSDQPSIKCHEPRPLLVSGAKLSRSMAAFHPVPPLALASWALNFQPAISGRGDTKLPSDASLKLPEPRIDLSSQSAADQTSPVLMSTARLVTTALPSGKGFRQ